MSQGPSFKLDTDLTQVCHDHKLILAEIFKRHVRLISLWVGVVGVNINPEFGLDLLRSMLAV